MRGLEKSVPTPKNPFSVVQSQGGQDVDHTQENPDVGRTQENQRPAGPQSVVVEKEKSQVSPIPTTSSAANESPTSILSTNTFNTTLSQ